MNGHPRYKAILDRMWELHDSKARDYGSDGDPLANLRNGERFGMPAWKRCLVEADSAFYRLENFCNGRNPDLASAKDALMDSSAFSLLALLFIEELEEKMLEQKLSPQETGDSSLPVITENCDFHTDGDGRWIVWPKSKKDTTGYRPPSEEIGQRMLEVLEAAK